MKQKLYSGKYLILILIVVFFSAVNSPDTFAQQSNFSLSNLNGINLSNPTSLQFGPDNRLYVAEQGGLIKVFKISKKASNSYSATATEIISLINAIPNHDDDGTLNSSVQTRQITGILVKGTAANPIIYVTSSDSRIGGPGGSVNLDTNSGIISTLSWNGSSWVKLDLVRGLPRSEENHASNGMQLNPKTNTLFVAQGGHTNAGSPCINFDYTCEYALSAAILSIDLTAINAMTTKGSGNNAYKYDLPTLNDPTRADNTTNIDINDPFGGDNGLNQAKIVSGGPVQVFAPGFRNAFDFLITKAGNMYTIDNGANQGWGGYPENEGTANVTNNYVSGEPGSSSASGNEAQINNLDNLHYIGNVDTYVPNSFYGGHPNPVRANPNQAGLYTFNGTTGVFRNSKSGSNPLPQDWPPVPAANPIEGDFQMPGVEDNAILTFSSSTNGLCEYTASNFNSSLKGSLLAANYDGYIENIGLTSDGTNVTNSKSSDNKLNQSSHFASNFGSQPLDVIAQGDNDIFPGTVWVAMYGAKAIAIFEPQDFTNCTGSYTTAADDDGDGYTNADEIDNGSNPCSSVSIPPDNDIDHISDLNDPDDDNDGINDTKDYFVLDKNNGSTASMPITYDLFNNYPQTGFFGLGFTGLMSNGNTNYSKLYADTNLIAGGAVGAFSVVAVSDGDALGTLNTQQNAFQFGLKPSNGSPFTIQSRLLSPFFNNKAQGSQSQGIYIGTGDQDNYIKIALNANGGQGSIEVVSENNGTPVTNQYSVSGILSSTTIDVFLSVDISAGTVQPKYSSNGGQTVFVGSPIQVSGALLTALRGAGTSAPAFAVGIIATSRNAPSFTATWDYIYVTTDGVATTGTWKTLTPSSGSIIGREENAYVGAGDKFYLMGGRGIVAVQEYDPKNKTWTNKANPPVELNHFQGVTLNGLIYAPGAMNGPYPHEVPLNNVYVYNPVSNNWFTGSTIPVARRRGATGAVTYKNKIYLVGGITDGHWSGWVSWFDEYDPAANTWKILPDAPHVRDHFQAVIINDKLYVAGGRRSSASTNQVFSLTVPEVDVYDFANGSWSTLPSGSNLPVPRAGASNVVLGNEVIVIGGESGIQTQAHSETHALNVVTNTWRRLADLQTGRHGTGAVVSNKDIYIASGPSDRGGSPLLTTQEDYFVTSPSAPNGTPLSQSQLSAPSALSLGSIAVNAQSSEVLTLSNTGSNQDILISSVTINGSNSFSYLAPFPFPFTIAPGKSIDVTVKFKPTATGGQTANLIIAHSGQGGSTTTSLSGTGTSTGTDQQITSFTLVNAITDQDIQTLNNGDNINLAALSSRSLNIRANASTSVGSVVFNLSGQETRNQTETALPLALFGDNGGNYNNWTPAVGSYTLKVTPYSSSGGKGTAGSPVTITFTVTDQGSNTTSQITSFTLVNATTDKDIKTLNNADVINLATLPSKNLNIRANTSSSVGSAVLNLSGQQSRTQTETAPPLALFGDAGGDYFNWTPAVGSYNLKATPYSGSGGSGTAGTSLSIGFSVINNSSATVQKKEAKTNAAASQEQVIALKAYPNPSDKGRFTVLLPSKFKGNISFTLLSLSGNRLTSGMLSLPKSTSTLSFDFSREMVAAGEYYLLLESKDQKTYIELMRSN